MRSWVMGAAEMWRSSVDEERLLFAGARLRGIRLAVWVGWASLAAIAVTTVVHTRHSEYAGHLEIWVLLAVAALAQAGAYLVPSGPRQSRDSSPFVRCPRRGPAPCDRVGQAGCQIPATGMFGHFVQTATLPGP